jgi:lysozyme family protein
MPEVQMAPDPKFDRAINILLLHEGKFCVDEGGATNYGISLRYAKTVGDLDGDGLLDFDFDHDGDVDEIDIRNMDPATARRTYRNQWWDRYHYTEFPDSLATKMLDLSVNMGPPQAHKLLQRAINACNHTITVDGVLGPQTISAVNSIQEDILLSELRLAALAFYQYLMDKNPQSRKNHGWLRRAVA